MINANEIRRMAGGEGLDASMLEKDYVLGWILYGISKSTIGKSLAFKGGTALPKVYYPGRWRLSEDLDFTLLDDVDWDKIIEALRDEIPGIVNDSIEINIGMRPRSYTNPEYLQAKMRYKGPVSPNTIKIEITKERFAGDIIDKAVPARFDYPEFSVKAYSIETIIAEKMRSIIQRGYIRDYYDVWRLLGESDYDAKKTKDLFLKKCEAKETGYSDMEQFFPQDIEKKLEPYVEVGLGRLMRDEIPSIGKMLEEIRISLIKIMSR